MTAPPLAHFLCDVDEMLARIDAIDPRAYDRTRNRPDGALTWLGPFVAQGITDTREIAERVLARHPKARSYRLLLELGWREFFHRTWQREGSGIFDDMHRAQEKVVDARPPRALLAAETGIAALDAAIAHLPEHGTMHNHARLWTAAIARNIGRARWREPARWPHHHLLDGELASNALSWQWAAGTFGAMPARPFPSFSRFWKQVRPSLGL